MVQKSTIRKILGYTQFIAGLGYLGFFDLFTRLGIDFPLFGVLKIRILLAVVLVISGLIILKKEVI